ncbi:hypothetical protein KM043_016841 [Ampulex compressa]|nr:hypothetical protein KM043_016841 [Ampulex compressa]
MNQSPATGGTPTNNAVPPFLRAHQGCPRTPFPVYAFAAPPKQSLTMFHHVFDRPSALANKGEHEENPGVSKRAERKAAAGALPREERKLIAQSAGARGKSTLATKNFNQQ